MFLYIGEMGIKVWLFLNIPPFFEGLRNTLPNLDKPLFDGFLPSPFFLALGTSLICGGSEVWVDRFLAVKTSGYHH